MCVSKLLTSVNIISLLAVTLSEQHLSDKQLNLTRVSLERTPFEVQQNILPLFGDIFTTENSILNKYATSSKTRVRREEISTERESNERESSKEGESSFQQDEVRWTTINEEVDTVIPMVLAHLQKLEIEHMQLPDMKETISVSPLLVTYEAGLFLTNGIVYNIDGIQRYGDAFMTYEEKTFLSRFNLILKSLQFEYNFLLKLMALEGYGKLIGSLENTIIYAELAINAANISLKLNDFRIMSFSNIHVQLDQMRLLGQLSGFILSPITNLFKDRITTSISDGLKDQMQMVMDDFNNDDPLELQKFAKSLLSGLTGQT